MGGAVKPVGWSQRLAQRMADDEKLLQEFAWHDGQGRDGRDVRRARDFVHHVRRDIGPNGVITQVEVRPTEVAASYYIEPDPSPGATAEREVPLPGQLTSSWAAGQPTSSAAVVLRTATAPADANWPSSP